MKKQVVAIILVMVLVITTFAACGKKYKMFTDKDGVEHPMVTDAEGNTVRNPDGNIAVYQTDKYGEVVTDKDGKDIINGIKFPEYIVKGQTIETEDFKFELSKEWKIEGLEAKRENTSMVLSISRRLGKTFDEVMKSMEDVYKNDPDSKVSFEKTQELLQIVGLQKGNKIITTIKNSETGENWCVEDYIFQINEHVYQASFTCNEKEKDLMDFSTIFEAIKVR